MKYSIALLISTLEAKSQWLAGITITTAQRVTISEYIRRAPEFIYYSGQWKQGCTNLLYTAAINVG